jgi:hypothetical protein
MTTELQVYINRLNALHSTGPQTETGKAVSKMNSVKHGIRSEQAVVPGETEEDWQQHRNNIVASVNPTTPLELALGERVALCLWRLNRIVRYETGSIREQIARIPEDERMARVMSMTPNKLRKLLGGESLDEDYLAEASIELNIKQTAFNLLFANIPTEGAVNPHDASAVLDALEYESGLEPDDAFFDKIGVPVKDCRPYEWDGWTWQHIHKAISIMAQENGETPEQLVAGSLRTLENQIEHLKERADLFAELERGKREKKVLPDATTLDKIMKYETHLAKQLNQSLKMLKELREDNLG